MTVYESPAKLNLALLVETPRADGMHPLQSLVQTIDWLDLLEVEESDEDNLVIEGADLDPEDNLVSRSLQAMRGRGFVPPLDVRLEQAGPDGSRARRGKLQCRRHTAGRCRYWKGPAFRGGGGRTHDRC